MTKILSVFFSQAIVKIGRFTTEADIVSSDIVEGNLFQQAENAMAILKSKYLISTISYEGIHRREMLEYPYQALREAIFNALIHRDYNSTSAIQIKIYNNSLSIANEGKLPPEITIADLKREHLSKPRNKLLADIFYKAGFIESWGRGTLKILSECKNAKIPEPVFFEEKSVVKVTFDLEVSSAELEKSSVELEVSSVELEKSSVKTSDEILLLLEQEAYITIPKMAELLGISTRAIEKQLANLKESGKLERIGPNKGGYWRVIPNVHIK